MQMVHMESVTLFSRLRLLGFFTHSFILFVDHNHFIRCYKDNIVSHLPTVPSKRIDVRDS